MKRLLLIASVVAIGAWGAELHAQWYGGYRNYGGYRGISGYGYGGGYGGGVGTAYSEGIRAQAQFNMAQGVAAANYARAAQINEQARSQYIDNEAKYIQMRRELRAAGEAEQAKRKANEKAKAALRPPPKPLAEIYPRLGVDQLDPLTGDIHWPDAFLGSEFNADRKVIEDALRTQAEDGANERTSIIVSDAAHRMMKTLSADYAKVGAENYSSDRRFLNSLSVEGDQAMKDAK